MVYKIPSTQRMSFSSQWAELIKLNNTHREQMSNFHEWIYEWLYIHSNGTKQAYKIHLAQNNDIGWTWRSNKADITESIYFNWIWSSNTVDALWSYKFYAGSCADGAAFSWNLINGVNYNMDNTTAGRNYIDYYHLSGGSINASDMVICSINNNEAHAYPDDLKIYGVYVKYKPKVD